MLGTYTPSWMTEDLSIFKDAVSKFMTAEFVPQTEKWHKQGMVDREAWTKAGEAGLLLTSIPEEYGGGGGGYLFIFYNHLVDFLEKGYVLRLLSYSCSCLLYTSPSPRDYAASRMPSSA